MSILLEPSTEHKTNKGFDEFWNFYYKKFGLDKSFREKKLIKFFLNCSNDYLLGNLWCCAFVLPIERKRYNKYIAKKHPKLDSFLFEMMELEFMKSVMSKNDYKEYLQELRGRLDELIEYYEKYFAN